MKKNERIITDGPVMRGISFIVLSLCCLIYALFDRLFLSMKITGRRHVWRLRKKGCITVANHTLFIEPGFIDHTLLFKFPYYAIQEETFVNPVAEWGLRSLRGFRLPRRGGIEKIKPQVAKVLKRGGAIHFFPEGHLTHFNQKPHPFKKGAFLLSLENQVPILPVATVIHPRLWRGKPISPYLFRLEMVILDPIRPPLCPVSKEEQLKLAGVMAKECHTLISDTIRVRRSLTKAPLV